jgi:hypothetical protein
MNYSELQGVIPEKNSLSPRSDDVEGAEEAHCIELSLEKKGPRSQGFVHVGEANVCSRRR